MKPFIFLTLLFFIFTPFLFFAQVKQVEYARAIKGNGSDCPTKYKGSFLDVGRGECWSCPAGYGRTLEAVDSEKACSKGVFGPFKQATKKGKPGCDSNSFPHGNTCYSCPDGFERTLSKIDGDKACEKNLFPCKGSVMSNGSFDRTEMYTYQILFYCTAELRDKKTLLIGLGNNKERVDYYYDEAKPNGCSTPKWVDPTGEKYIVNGDNDNWQAACNVHDWMYSTLPPKGKESEWKAYADRALKINAASICQQIWAAGSPGLGGCFDGAKNMHNWLRNAEGAITSMSQEAYDSGQNKAKENEIRLELDEYNKIINYINANDVPTFFTSWNPNGTVLID
ncbi:MAG: hypothetical protein AAGI23_01800 [Bacteroidota bacterium]